jgi:hypothetical protein
MMTRRLLAGAVLVLAASGDGVAAREDLARAIAARLVAKKAIAPRTHTSDFATDQLGCITLTARELRAFGVRGHAFLCEDAGSGEVLGAVLSRSGAVRCYISGRYVGDGCYDFGLCGADETACVW